MSRKSSLTPNLRCLMMHGLYKSDVEDGSLTLTVVVSNVAVIDGASESSGRRLYAGIAGVRAFVYFAQHSPVKWVVLKRDDATFAGNCPHAGEGNSFAAEAILPGE